MFTRWIHSYRDLPLKINQWANVTRWEMRTKSFIRTLEFLRQEGHTAHTTLEEAEKEAMQMFDVYTKFSYEEAAIPVIPGRKSRVETFSGADRTYTIEAMMGDRKALQEPATETSTLFFGGIIMPHEDDAGLMLPPRVASVQVVIVPIWKKADEKNEVLDATLSIKDVFHTAGIKVKLDDSDQRTPGWKFNFWEMKGVPLKIEIGPRDVSRKSVVISRRYIPGNPGKVFGISMESSVLVPYVKEKLDEIQLSLSDKATTFRDSDEDELRVKEATGATLHVFLLINLKAQRIA